MLDELLDRSDLQRHGFTHFVGLTYGVDLPWFEEHLGRQLELAGVRRIVVLADQAALDTTLEAQLGLLSGAGRRFVVQGVQTDVSFHPKAYLLAGPREARLYVGSGNLNTSGLGRNREIFERWDARVSATVPKSFDGFRVYVTEILQKWLPRTVHVERALRSAFAMPIFAGPFAVEGGELHGSPGALMDGVKKPTTAASRLVMTAPFFDAAGEAACDLAKRFEAAAFDVIVDRSMTNLSLDARQAIEAAGGRVRALVETRRCHAKALYAEGEDWSFSVHGSANLSNAAWHGHNAELVVFRKGADARSVGTLLGELAAEELTEEAWAHVHEQAKKTVPPVAPEAAASNLVLHSAQWLDATRVEVVTSGAVPEGAVVEVRARDASRDVPVQARASSGPLVVEVPAAEGNRPVTAIRIRVAKWSGRWVVVHDASELERTARGRTAIDDRVERVVQFGGRDPEGGADLLELLTEAVRLRSEALRSPTAKRSSHKPAPSTGGAEWHWVEEYVEGEPELADEALGSTDRSRVYALDPVRIIDNLIAGDARKLASRSDALEDEEGREGDEGEGGGGGNSAAPPRPPTDRPRRDLLDAAERARAVFVFALDREGGDLPAEHLLTDVLVLAAALQSGVHRERLTDLVYAKSMEDVLRALLGSAQSAYPRALANIPPEQRRVAWARGWLLIGPLLVLWHVSMARRAARGEDRMEDAVRRDAIGLWFRNVLRHAPRESVAELVAEAERQLPAIERFGALWLADRWKGFAEAVPFLTFVRDVLEDAEALLAIEPVLQPALPSGVKRNAVEGDRVVGRGRDGSLAVGFMDDDNVALLCDGAFQNACHSDARWRFKKSAPGQVMTLEAAQEVLLAASQDASNAGAVLNRLEV
ncbi:phospholipase D-like domain-containing protein [Anaeromyxobacter oryzisoli]|uniref:hypothetical protein n=1 Tax=Anaeromyxobacter oryzisoli TaxID=2925408 RepID=UPI001F589A8E|nr:hypothetical protein [Anaeromyxobacter sp. SG63]